MLLTRESQNKLPHCDKVQGGGAYEGEGKFLLQLVF